MPRRKNDILLKSAFEETFPDLLRFYFPDADEIFDMDRGFEFLDKELGELFPELEKKEGSRFVDMLAKGYLKNGQEEWILVHTEIQGGNDKRFTDRMFEYWYRIYDKYKVKITALVVFTGAKNQKRPDTFHRSFLGTEITYRYNTYHILEQDEKTLLSMKNPFAFVVLAAQQALLSGKIPEVELNQKRLLIAKALIDSKIFNHARISRFLYFLKQFVYIENPNLNSNFDKKIDQLTGKQNTMGIIEAIKKIEREEAFEKGMEKGLEKGKTDFVKYLLSQSDFKISKIAELVGVSESFVRKVKKTM